jgi:hypothetical protein
MEEEKKVVDAVPLEDKRTNKFEKVKKFYERLSPRALVIAACIVIIAAAAAYVVYAKRGWFIAATVNGTTISRLSVIEELEKQNGKNVLDSIITKKLIADEAAKLGVSVSGDDIEAQIQKIRDQISGQGVDLESALAQQGMTIDELREQIVLSKELEQILADKIAVSDDEITQYLKENKLMPAKGDATESLKDSVREQLKSQKLSTAAQQWVEDIKSRANIIKYVQY